MTLELTAAQLRNLADALDGLTELSKTTGVDFTPFDRIQIQIDGYTVYVNNTFADDRRYTMVGD